MYLRWNIMQKKYLTIFSTMIFSSPLLNLPANLKPRQVLTLCADSCLVVEFQMCNQIALTSE
jgi:hypothetical protein